MTGLNIAFILASLAVAAMALTLRRRVAVSGDQIAATLLGFAVIGVAVAIGRSVPPSGAAAGFFRNPTVYLGVGALVAGLWVTLDIFDASDSSQWTTVTRVLTAFVVGGVDLLAAESFQ